MNSLSKQEMKTVKKHSVIGAALASVSLLAVAGCWHDSPCEEGYVVVTDMCYKIPVAPAPAPAAEAGAGEAAAPATDTFGKTCTAQADCAGGTAPVCAAPQLPYCTQINCMDGEANAGSCPTGFTCIAAGAQSACVKM